LYQVKRLVPTKLTTTTKSYTAPAPVSTVLGSVTTITEILTQPASVYTEVQIQTEENVLPASIITSIVTSVQTADPVTEYHASAISVTDVSVEPASTITVYQDVTTVDSYTDQRQLSRSMI